MKKVIPLLFLTLFLTACGSESTTDKEQPKTPEKLTWDDPNATWDNVNWQ